MIARGLCWRRMKPERLTPSESIVLDIVRVGAAIAVAGGHITQRFFSTGLPDLVPISRASVAVFFVLSGFVIRHVTLRRSTTLGGYLMDRASRIYSVAAPALLITAITAYIAFRVNPEFYGFWHSDLSPAASLLANFTFMAENWTLDIRPLTNPPFWSLNYEVIYYLLYGFGFYLTGYRRWVLVAVVSIIAGPKILLLFPVWFIGCYAHDVYQRWNAEGTAANHLDRLILAIGVAVAGLLIAGVLSPTFRHGAMAARDYMKAKGEEWQLGNTGGAVTFVLFGVLGTPFLLRVMLLVRNWAVDVESKTVRAVRFVAEGTFPIYLLHFPLYVVIAACIPYNHASLLQKGLIVSAVVVLGVLIGHPCNVLKLKIRALTEGDERRATSVLAK